LLYSITTITISWLFSGEPGLVGLSRFLSELVLEDSEINGTVFKDQMPYSLPNKQHQSTEGNSKQRPNQWSGLILSSSTTWLLKEAALLLPLPQLSKV